MAESARPRLCPAIKWCDKGNFPCYCEDAPGPVQPGGSPTGPSPGETSGGS